MDSLEYHVRDKLANFEEIISTQSSRIQQLEEELAKKSDNTSQVTQQQAESHDPMLAEHCTKLAEPSLPLDMMYCKNTDGVLLWKITEVERQMREAISGQTPSIYSQPFFTSANGYKMCARLFLNGDGAGGRTHLSLFVAVMRGEYDSLLPWPFQQKVTLVLIDQDHGHHISDTFIPDPSSHSWQRPQSQKNIATGCPKFVPLAILNHEGYIKDDVMFIKVVVDSAIIYTNQMDQDW